LAGTLSKFGLAGVRVGYMVGVAAHGCTASTGPQGQRFTMMTPWTVLFLDDARMIHETTPIQPVDDAGWRDTLVLTFRARGFQGEGATG